MVRTKASSATRVAAGSKIPKKSMNHIHHSPSQSPTEKGKDNLPINRYFPRPTPPWQKKITQFYNNNIILSPLSTELSTNCKDLGQNDTGLKRSSSKLDEDDNMEINITESNFKRMKTIDNMDIFSEETNRLKNSTEIHETDSMEMDD